MPSNGLGLKSRLGYLAERARRINIGSVIERAKEASAQHGKAVPAVVVDMLWSAGRHNVGFQDYIDSLSIRGIKHRGVHVVVGNAAEGIGPDLLGNAARRAGARSP